ncbi:Ribonucleoside-diphosphate reductase small chain [Cedratvirus Zaza IHUMI]|uniref:ribonucleoside-diphosphate reductase n=1 Tax=Cedratvirus Zaza IHUMI TaxID=2126979 RepID=A0A2R8FE27_9VIRU|nr:Ribonucleoside-diphosphate reductase small chain [Cedratvirus Zaza IHUMI]
MENEKKISSIVKDLRSLSDNVKDSDRYSLYPIRDRSTFRFFNTHVGTVWNNAEMDYSRDKEDYEKLTTTQQYMLGTILAFFSSADGVILDNLAFRFILEARSLEEKAFYVVQQYMELIHSEGYSLAIDSLISDPDKKREFFEAADNHASVRRKNQFMEKYLYSDIEKPYRLVAFACAEGIFFLSAFLVVFWFRSQGKLANFIFLNEQVSKDETLHRNFAVHLIKQIKEYYRSLGMEVSSDLIKEIVLEAVEIEIEFMQELLVEDQNDLTKQHAISYIYRLANSLLLDMEEEATYPEQELPTWINDLCMEQKSNSYEVRGGNYRTRSTDEEEAETSAYQGEEDDF